MMDRKLYGLICLCLVVISGCGTKIPTFGWVKEGASPDEVRIEKAKCEQEALNKKFAGRRDTGSTTTINANIFGKEEVSRVGKSGVEVQEEALDRDTAALIKACMEIKGFIYEKVGEATLLETIKSQPL